MTDALPSIKLTIDPRHISRIGYEPLRVGGVRVKTTIYVVTEPDIPGSRVEPVVQVVTVPTNEKVELRIAE